MRKLTRFDWYFLGGITLAAFLLRFVNLSHPKEIVFDETYFANFAHNYLTNTKFFDAEPPLAKFIIAAGEKIWGFNSFGWRVMPALFGTLLIPLIYVLTKKLFGNYLVPMLAALLALFDGLLLVESRTAVIDIFVVFFNLATYLAFFMSLQASTRKRSFWWLASAGVFFGFGLATKWIALACIVPILVVLVLLALADKPWLQKFLALESGDQLYRAFGAKRRNVQSWLAYGTLLMVVPAALYFYIFSKHVPFDSTGESIWGIHKQIFNYHHNLKATHPYGSVWYTWPFMIRPVAYYFNAGSGWSAIVAMGNPIIWWSGVVAAGYAVWRGSKEVLAVAASLGILAVITSGDIKRFVAFTVLLAIAVGVWQLARRGQFIVAFALLAILAHFGPWSLISRVLFIYHYLAALPFVIMVLAWALSQVWKWKPKDASPLVFSWVILTGTSALLAGLVSRTVFGGLPMIPGFLIGAIPVLAAVAYFIFADVLKLTWAQKQVIVFVALCGLSFIFFLPILTAIPLDSADYYRHMWFRSSWI